MITASKRRGVYSYRHAHEETHKGSFTLSESDMSATLLAISHVQCQWALILGMWNTKHFKQLIIIKKITAVRAFA